MRLPRIGKEGCRILRGYQMITHDTRKVNLAECSVMYPNAANLHVLEVPIPTMGIGQDLDLLVFLQRYRTPGTNHAALEVLQPNGSYYRERRIGPCTNRDTCSCAMDALQ